jgi:hypothetical protein
MSLSTGTGAWRSALACIKGGRLCYRTCCVLGDSRSRQHGFHLEGVLPVLCLQMSLHYIACSTQPGVVTPFRSQ